MGAQAGALLREHRAPWGPHSEAGRQDTAWGVRLRGRPGGAGHRGSSKESGEALGRRRGGRPPRGQMQGRRVGRAGGLSRGAAPEVSGEPHGCDVILLALHFGRVWYLSDAGSCDWERPVPLPVTGSEARVSQQPGAAGVGSPPSVCLSAPPSPPCVPSPSTPSSPLPSLLHTLHFCPSSFLSLPGHHLPRLLGTSRSR